MTIRDLVVKFGFDVDRNSEKQAENSIKGIKNLATKLLSVIKIGFSIAGMASLAEAAADAEALKSQFTQTFGELEIEASNRLERIAEDTGIMVNRMKGSFSQITAFAKTTGMETSDALELADRAMAAVADSAAYYDRSLENVTDSLQSFLKGNFENDAALGLSCTETTRNAAANALYGKSFKDLAEDQKQLTLLKMVEDANRASGALGQAARESDTWTNQLGNLKQSLTDLKAAAGSTFLKPAVKVLKVLTSLVQKATKAIQSLTKENGLLTRATERYHALVKKLQPAIDRMTETLSKGLNKGIQVVKRVIDKLGGVENALRILAIVAAAFLVVMNWSKIVSVAGTFLKLLSKIGKLFSFANLKILILVSIFAFLALLVEDFFQFLAGNDSILGTVFDQMGISADHARQAIFDAFRKIKEFLLNVWEFLKEAADIVFRNIKDFILKYGEQIKEDFERIWGLIKTFLSGIGTFLSQLVETIFGDIFSTVDSSSTSTKEKLLSIWQAIVNKLSAVWNALYEAGSEVFHAIAIVVETIFGWIQSFWNNWGSQILAWFKVLWDSIGNILNDFLEIIKGVANFIKSVFTGDWQGAWTAIQQIFTNVWDAIINFVTFIWDTIKLLFSMALAAIKSTWETIWNGIKSFLEGIWNGIVDFVKNTFEMILSGITTTVNNIKEVIINGFTKAIDWIRSLPSQALQWGSDIIHGIVDGITGAIGKVVDAVKGIASKIKSFLHFSTPDEGPLTDYESWMPDFMNGLAGSMQSSSGVINEVIQSISIAMKEGFIQAFDSIKQVAETEMSQIITIIETGMNQFSSILQIMLPQAQLWGKDFMNGLKDGMINEMGVVTGAVQNVAKTIQSFLHFSVPDKGPLTDYESWMPDFMRGLAKGIGDNEKIVLDKVKNLTNHIMILTQATTAQAATAANSTIQNTTSNMTQNVNINNSYSGGSIETQKNVSKAMKKSAVDTTTYLARGLAYARG